MKLRKQIEENVVKPFSNTKYDMFLATVLSYDEINNTASIVFEDPNIKSQMYLDNVPVQLGSGGVHSSGPYEGDQVWISFQNSTPLNPKIISLADEDYKNKTREQLRHKRKGSLIPFDINKPLDNTPKKDNLSSWFTSSENSYIYLYFKDLTPLDTLSNNFSSTFYYNSSDPGITHPSNSSTIRIRENGCIDIFVGTNEGIRINPNDKSINIFGTNILEKGMDKKSLINSLEHTGEDIKISADTWTIKGKSISIESEDTVKIECNKFILKANEKEGF